MNSTRIYNYIVLTLRQRRFLKLIQVGQDVDISIGSHELIHLLVNIQVLLVHGCLFKSLNFRFLQKLA